MYGASGTYMLGSFDGQTFTPEAGEYYYYTGSMYAAQTYSNIPAVTDVAYTIRIGDKYHMTVYR